jgi:hypothetical protein
MLPRVIIAWLWTRSGRWFVLLGNEFALQRRWSVNIRPTDLASTMSRNTARYRSARWMRRRGRPDPDGVHVVHHANIVIAFVKCITPLPKTIFFSLRDNVSRFGAPTQRRDADQDCHRDEILNFCPRQKHRFLLCEFLLSSVILAKMLRRRRAIGLRHNGFLHKRCFVYPAVYPARFQPRKNCRSACSIGISSKSVRSTPKSGHVRCTSPCLLWANSGISPIMLKLVLARSAASTLQE